jgi:hypothetical protein
MTVDAIRAQLEKTPFRPINLITSSGKSYLVPHPELLMFSPGGRTCLVFAGNGEYYSTLDVLTITEVVPAKRRPAARKKR